MKRPLLAVALALLATAAGADAPLATLAEQQGTVLVNQGDVFETAADLQALRAGDRIMVMEGGSATVLFSDGCPMVLESGSLMLVPEQSTCTGAIADVQRIGPSYAQLIGSDNEQRDRDEWIIFVVSVAVIGALLAGHDVGDGDPVSP